MVAESSACAAQRIVRLAAHFGERSSGFVSLIREGGGKGLKKPKSVTLSRKSIQSVLMGIRCQFGGFRMCSSGKKYIGLHKAAPNEILFGYRRVNTSGSAEFKVARNW